MSLQNNLSVIANNKKYLFLALPLGFIVLFLVFFFTTGGDKATTEQNAPTSVPNETTYQELYESREPSDISLTQDEQSYTDAKPQTFADRDTSKTGTLIVESDPPGAHIVIDVDSGHEVVGYTFPDNTAPIKATRMPVGRYVVAADIAGDYDYAEEVFTIEENKVTRVKLTLPPIDVDESINNF